MMKIFQQQPIYEAISQTNLSKCIIISKCKINPVRIYNYVLYIHYAYRRASL